MGLVLLVNLRVMLYRGVFICFGLVPSYNYARVLSGDVGYKVNGPLYGYHRCG